MVGRILPQMIEVRQGDSFTIPLQFKGRDGFIDITGSELKMEVRNSIDNKIILSKKGVVDDGIKGKAHLTISPADTKICLIRAIILPIFKSRLPMVKFIPSIPLMYQKLPLLWSAKM